MNSEPEYRYTIYKREHCSTESTVHHTGNDYTKALALAMTLWDGSVYECVEIEREEVRTDGEAGVIGIVWKRECREAME
jgi:hypothetical protein